MYTQTQESQLTDQLLETHKPVHKTHTFHADIHNTPVDRTLISHSLKKSVKKL